MGAAAQTVPPGRGWQARLELGFRAGPRCTVLAERRRCGPLAVQRPFYPEGEVCHVYLLHPPGGVVGGDALSLDVQVGRSASALVTTPGATKFYRSAGDTARQVQHLRVEAGASLEWLPQENIFFAGAEVELETRVELRGDARLIWWEIQCLGRPAIAEGFDRGHIDSCLGVARDGVPLVLERLRVSADNRARRSLMAGFAVSATLLISHAGEPEVAVCRELLSTARAEYAGATLLDDLLVVRCLGNSTESAKRLLTDIWRALRPRILGRAPSMPRIWAT